MCSKMDDAGRWVHDWRMDASGPEPQPDVTATTPVGWCLEHTYAELPEELHAPAAPTPVREPRLMVLNKPLATALGLDTDALMDQAGAAIFGGNHLPPGAKPIAQAYAGHQFGHFTTLGDGRAILLGEQITPQGNRLDIQLKGAGRTPFSRNGDGRAALGPMLREYIISEAMHALGIPTTRSLAVVATGEVVQRHRPLPGAILTRVATSHIRVGTFEGLAARRDTGALNALLQYTLHRHHPDRIEANNPALALLEATTDLQAALIAKWMHIGFVHGVMNTDNMALSGETIDYGPCAFIDVYDPATVFSSIDRRGRYAFGNQGPIAQWNLARLAESLLPLIDPDEEQAIAKASELIESFAKRFDTYWLRGMRQKLGLLNEEADDASLIQALLAWMEKHQADYTNTFRALTLGKLPVETSAHGSDPDILAWNERWSARRERQPATLEESRVCMQAHNPAFIPRNHRVEEALEAAENRDDLSLVQQLMNVLAKPYDYSIDNPAYSDPPEPGEGVYQTFCGT